MSGRPEWHTYFLDVAAAVAQRADCSRSKVGAVLVDSTHRIRGTGYNGSSPGGPSCLAGECPRGLKGYDEVPHGTSYDTSEGACIAIHAELNLMLYTAPEEREGAKVYLTREPCDACFRILKGSGIVEIHWPEAYYWRDSTESSVMFGPSPRGERP